MANQLKYTFCDAQTHDFVMTPPAGGAFDASQKLPAAGGRFVKYSASGVIWQAVANDPANVTGWCELETDTMPGGTASTKATSSTKGATLLPVIDVKTRIIELPYGGAAVGAGSVITDAIGGALINKPQYLYVDTNGVQWFSTSGSNANFIVKGYDVYRNTVKVMVLDTAIAQVA